MKTIILITTLLLSINSFAHSSNNSNGLSVNGSLKLMLNFPEGTETLTLTATVNGLDTCNSHSLSLIDVAGANSGRVYVDVIGSQVACLTPPLKSKVLSAEIQRPHYKRSIEFIFNPKVMSSMSFDFK